MNETASEPHASAPHISEEDRVLLRPILETTNAFYITASILVAIVCFGFYAWTRQVQNGLQVTGLNRPIFWGVYITNFVFFIGISHAGTLISAILRICKAEWRRSITRCAEVITVMVLVFGVANVLADLGRPDRALNVLLHPQFRSPLLWDVTSISCYLTGSVIYLFLPLIPDIALLRDLGVRPRWFYRLLALGWSGSARQHLILDRAISAMAIIIIPIAISVHTVVSWVFAMTIQPFWHSTIFGPYFVAGAIFSGIAALIISMAILRRVYHLEDYLRPIHFNHLGVLLLVMTLFWFYFTFGEYLTAFYGGEPSHMIVFWAKVTGKYAVSFWSMVACCFIIPLAILIRAKTRTVAGTVVASSTVIVGMWLERYTIVVPTLNNPRLPIGHVTYMPTWVEWAYFAACTSMFILLYMVFTKFFPIVSIWEVQEGRQVAIQESIDRIRSYLPGIPLPGEQAAAGVAAKAG